MKILQTEQIRAADAYTIEHEPIPSINLMERAASVFVDWYIGRFPKDDQIAVFAGMGNNGGDGLAVARMLSEEGYQVDVFIVRYSDHCSEDLSTNLERLSKLKDVNLLNIHSKDDLNLRTTYQVVIDALWGSGINRAIEGLGADVLEFINALDTTRIAIDVPSGLAADFKNESITFHADYTLSFELPKLSFMYACNHPYVGDWHISSIGLSTDFIEKQKTDFYLLDGHNVTEMIRPRRKFSHKGTNGHSLVIAGSKGKIGAAILTGKACLKIGSGLVTLRIPQTGLVAVHAACPELMLSIDQEEDQISHTGYQNSYNSIAIGPGIGQGKKTAEALLLLLKECDHPIVIDADALNIIAAHPQWRDHIPQNSILTPHPGEFERLFGSTSDEYERTQLQIMQAKSMQCFIVLKGAHTAIACPDGSCWFNATGNPALATAGSGDVLTGIITGLMAQGYTPKECALLGVYIHGMAADLHAGEFDTERMIASDIIEMISRAWTKAKDD